MDDAAVFTPDHGRFLPGPDATGPWGRDRLHGGPVLGLIARAIEAATEDPELIVARLTFDLFRPVPVAPLAVRVETRRQSGRLRLLEAAVQVEGEDHVRATALLLRASDAGEARGEAARPAGPDGIPTESLMRGFARSSSPYPPGFHTRAETRWVPRTAEQPLAIWFRLPIPLVAGEPTSAFQRAVALSDFANAVASIAAAERDRRAAPFINADGTLYLARRPEGEWFCLQAHGDYVERGVSVAETLLWDARGALGRVLQARLVNRAR